MGGKYERAATPRVETSTLRAVLASFGDLYFRISGDCTFLDCQAPADRLHVPPDEFLGRHVRDVLPAPLAARIVAAIGQALTTGTTVALAYDLEAGGSVREDDPLRPSSPYSAAKAAGDLQVTAYVRTYEVDALVTRGSNTYGPNQYPEKLLPLFLTNALDGEPLPMYGDGRQVRDWLFVEDHCAGIDAALRRGTRGEIYNVGGGEEHENREITRLVLEATGAPDDLVRRVEDRAGHDRRYSLDTGKARTELGWSPQVPFAEGFARTARWYAENRAWWEPIKSSGGYRDYYERQYAERLKV